MEAESGFLKTPVSFRQVDILVFDKKYAGQVKSGYVSYDKKNQKAIKKDSLLVDAGWKVEHILDNGASQQYLQALRNGGISYHIPTKNMR